MLKKITLAVALVTIGALPAMAQGTCTAPMAPAAVDGNTASKDQILAGIKDAKAFIAASDTYQECLGSELTRRKSQAAADKAPLDPAVEKAIDDKAAANQTQKEKVGADINGAVGAYKKLHPN